MAIEAPYRWLCQTVKTSGSTKQIANPHAKPHSHSSAAKRLRTKSPYRKWRRRDALPLTPNVSRRRNCHRREDLTPVNPTLRSRTASHDGTRVRVHLQQSYHQNRFYSMRKLSHLLRKSAEISGRMGDNDDYVNARMLRNQSMPKCKSKFEMQDCYGR